MVRKPTIGKMLPPVISVDTGQVSTAALVRVRGELVDAATILNPEPPKVEIGVHARNLSPEYGYLAAIRATITQYLAVYDEDARGFWERRRQPVPPGQSPFLLAIEKVNYPSLLPGKRVTECETGSVFAPKGIAEGIAGWWGPERVIWVCPVHCDDRWEPRHGGTGNPYDYFPDAILNGVERDRDGNWPSLDDPRFRPRRTKDLAAAWSIASDAAEDYSRICYRRHKSVLPPHAAPDTFGALRDELAAYWVRRTGAPLPKPKVITLSMLTGRPAA